jgi:hypothetical protein
LDQWKACRVQVQEVEAVGREVATPKAVAQRIGERLGLSEEIRRNLGLYERR